jgi:hypothetical protein
MAKPPKKAGTDWSAGDVKELKKLAKGNTPTPLIAYKLERTEAGIRGKAQTEGISLNKSPYGSANKKK